MRWPIFVALLGASCVQALPDTPGDSGVADAAIAPDVAVDFTDLGRARDAVTDLGAAHVDAGGFDRSAPDARRSDLSSLPDRDSDPDATVDGEPCSHEFRRCSGFARVETCVQTPAGLRLQRETCVAGSGCLAGQCVPGRCSDECTLHEPGCGLFSVSSGQEVALDPVNSTADRARAYRRHIEKDVMPQGGIADLFYSDETLSQPVGLGEEYDSAEFTGAYLMAQALRLMSTGSADAARVVARVSESMDLRFRVTGSPGYMARFVQSVDHPPAAPGDFTCPEDPSDHCDVEYSGEHYNWMGNTSRDMYSGAVPGMALAYQASSDPRLRALLREHLVDIVEQLMIERSLPVTFVVNGGRYDRDLVSRYLILNPAEFNEDGRVIIGVDTSDIEDSSELLGVRDFLPDMAPVFRQLALLRWIPDIPRRGTALMLSGFFLAALMATEGVPEYAGRRQAIEAFYLANKEYWTETARGWGYDRACGKKYYAANIGIQAAFLFAYLSDDARVYRDMVGQEIYAPVRDHKNPWFALLTGGPAGASVELSQRMQMAVRQIELFGPPPRQHLGVDLSAQIPADSDCSAERGEPTAPPDQAIDLNLRPAENFQWQRHPWRLQSGNYPTHVFAGADYLAAYWMARYYGQLQDDRPGVCTRWR